MPLQFPTQAERALAAWRALTTTAPVEKIARAHGATRYDEDGAIVWLFDDDTRLVVRGRGPNHQITAELP